MEEAEGSRRGLENHWACDRWREALRAGKGVANAVGPWLAGPEGIRLTVCGAMAVDEMLRRDNRRGSLEASDQSRISSLFEAKINATLTVLLRLLQSAHPREDQNNHAVPVPESNIRRCSDRELVHYPFRVELNHHAML